MVRQDFHQCRSSDVVSWANCWPYLTALLLDELLSVIGAGALGTYLWKNRGMQRNADQVFVILGAALLAIAWGAKSDTFVDNVGKHLIETPWKHSLTCTSFFAGARLASHLHLLCTVSWLFGRLAGAISDSPDCSSVLEKLDSVLILPAPDQFPSLWLLAFAISRAPAHKMLLLNRCPASQGDWLTVTSAFLISIMPC